MGGWVGGWMRKGERRDYAGAGGWALGGWVGGWLTYQRLDLFHSNLGTDENPWRFYEWDEGHGSGL